MPSSSGNSLLLELTRVVRFMAPGLTRPERQILYAALPSVGILFAIGAGFAFALVSPAMVKFLAQMGGPYLRADLRAAGTLSMAINISLWMGLIFQMPLVMFVVARFGIISSRRV